MTKKRDHAIEFYMLAIDTRHFEFRTFGRTADEAKELMQRAWAIHCRQCDADPDLLTNDINDTEPELITVPSMWRDRSELTEKTATTRVGKLTGKITTDAAPFADMPDSPKRDRMLEHWRKSK